jgi:gluconate 2-dehydrogenase gamma chain
MSPDLLDVLAAAVERLIPSDDTGPGAREACVCEYIESMLESGSAEQHALYETGLRALDGEARSVHAAGFAELPADDQNELLRRAELGEMPREAGLAMAEFFEFLRTHAIEGMFGDPRHGGNAGFAGWRLVGYRGPRLTVPACEQELDVALSDEFSSVDDHAIFTRSPR